MIICNQVSPTLFHYKGYRFFFFSKEEARPHVHVYCGDGEAKFWVEPEVSLARNYGLSEKQVREIQEITEERKDEIREGWKKYFQN